MVDFGLLFGHIQPMIRLPPHEFQLLSALSPGASLSIAELTKLTGLDQSLLTAGAQSLSERGLVTISEQAVEEYSLTAAGQRTVAEGLPERAALKAVTAAGGTVTFADLPKLTGCPDTRSLIKWLIRRGWCVRDQQGLAVTKEGITALNSQEPDEALFAQLSTGPRTTAELKDAGVNLGRALELLQGRSELYRIRRRTSRFISLTTAGIELKQGGIEPSEEVNQLTADLITTGRWREVDFRRYDVTLPAARIFPGKRHPLQRIIQETRQAFLQMGFEEVSSPVVETAFWDFDALFQPQDHPAREMQDTFYMATPATGSLPAPDLVERVKRTHESGGDTGSTGWGYSWNAENARRLVLRTHTTAATIRALAAQPIPPRKVFAIGKVFRRENIDPTHLPEFFQIDGIIVDDHVSLATLFATLTEFYLRLGAREVRFRPSFFPYTEPSAEVFVNIPRLGWIEMCGCGIFRPEVTLPLGCRTPVAAWGGGVERLAMLRFGIEDIRKLYWADIDWLREARLCR